MEVEAMNMEYMETKKQTKKLISDNTIKNVTLPTIWET